MAGKQLRVQNRQQMNGFRGITIREDSSHNVDGRAFDLKTQNIICETDKESCDFLKAMMLKALLLYRRLVQTEPSGEP